MIRALLFQFSRFWWPSFSIPCPDRSPAARWDNSPYLGDFFRVFGVFRGGSKTIGVGPEWRLVKAQNFIMKRDAFSVTGLIKFDFSRGKDHRSEAKR
jgi:hypothetical protein